MIINESKVLNTLKLLRQDNSPVCLYHLIQFSGLTKIQTLCAIEKLVGDNLIVQDNINFNGRVVTRYKRII